MNSYYSNIYWHFTGSPRGLDWTKVFCPRDMLRYGKPKTDADAVDVLGKIVRSNTLLAMAREKIDNHIFSDAFCCVTDIPIQNLLEHKKYYGNAAIGFRAAKVHRHFNPVIYLSKKFIPVRSKKYEELNQEERSAVMMRHYGRGTTYKNFRLEKLIQSSSIDEDSLGSFLFHHFKVTHFSEDPAETFYKEREWRKLGDFHFKPADIAALIVSEESLPAVRAMLNENGNHDIAVLTWELLEKM